MAKSLKDIVEEGFAKLEGLAEKRREILARAEQIKENAPGSQNDAALSKLRNAETALVDETNSRGEQILKDLEKTLAQESDNNQLFIESNNSKLKLRIAGALTELAHTKSHLLDGSVERLDSLFAELEKDADSARRHLNLQVERLISELEGACRSNHADLLKTQSEVEAGISLEIQPLNTALSEVLSKIIGEIESRRTEITDNLTKLYKKQTEKLNSDPDEEAVAPILNEQKDLMKDLCSSAERKMRSFNDEILSSNLDKLKQTCQQSFTELETIYNECNEKSSKQFHELNQLHTVLLKNQQLLLSERSQNIKIDAESICATLIAGEERNRLDKAFIESSGELTGLTNELDSKLEELLRAQNDSLSKLSISANKGLQGLLDEFKSQLQAIVKQEEEIFCKKEEALYKQLQNLEDQVPKISAGSGADGGSKE